MSFPVFVHVVTTDGRIELVKEWSPDAVPYVHHEHAEAMRKGIERLKRGRDRARKQCADQERAIDRLEGELYNRPVDGDAGNAANAADAYYCCVELIDDMVQEGVFPPSLVDTIGILLERWRRADEEIQAANDYANDRAMIVSMFKEALGVPDEPHQGVDNRILDALRELKDERHEHKMAAMKLQETLDAVRYERERARDKVDEMSQHVRELNACIDNFLDGERIDDHNRDDNGFFGPCYEAAENYQLRAARELARIRSKWSQ